MGDPLVLFLWVLSFFKCIGLSKTSHLWVLNLYLKRNLISDGWIPILDAEKSPEIPIFSGWNHHSYCFFSTLITSFVGEITMKFSLFEVDYFPMVRPPASLRTAWGFLDWSCSAVEDFTRGWTRKMGIFPGKSRSFPGKNPGISRGTVGFDYESGWKLGFFSSFHHETVGFTLWYFDNMQGKIAHLEMFYGLKDRDFP